MSSPRGRVRWVRVGAMFRLDGKVALVTGAASGIGAATAEMMAKAGADVACAWFKGDPHDVSGTVTAVEAAGRRAIAIEGDVSTTADCERIVAETVAKFGRIDIVLANAAIARDVPSVELDDARLEQLIQIDLLGVFRTFRAALPHLIAQKSGRLLATSSVAGAVQGWPRHVHYTMAKGGVVGLIRSLALEVAQDGITVNGIAPGVVVTPQTQDPVNSLGDSGLEVFKSKQPLGRNGRPEEIAAVYTFLASDEASFVTGQVITVDGGVTLSLA